MKFWIHHEEAMRKARLLQSAATIFASPFWEMFTSMPNRVNASVEYALAIEQNLETKLARAKSNLDSGEAQGRS